MQYDIPNWNRILAKPTISVLPGWKREHWIAYLANKHKWTLGAELGIFRGQTFLHVLKSCPQLTLIGVDLWEPQPDNKGPENYMEWPHQQNEKTVREGAAQFGDRAIIYKMLTSEAAKFVEDNSLDFVFVDADHGTDAVRNDILTWLPKIKDSGCILGHDINWPTIKVVVDELLPGYVIGPDNAYGRQKVIRSDT
jgi:hypothetical protein